MLISLWLCKKGNEPQVWHILYSTYSPWVQHISYSAAPASLNHPHRMLKVGLQTSRLQQTWLPQWPKMSFPSGVFWSLGTYDSLKGPDQVTRQGVSALQSADLPTTSVTVAMCEEALSWRNSTPCDSFPCRLETSACFTLSKRDMYYLAVIVAPFSR